MPIHIFKGSAASRKADLSPSAMLAEWEALRKQLPATAETLMTSSGALQRRRKVRSGWQLLHLILLYVTFDFSLRSTAFWAKSQGLANLTEGALRKRFHASVWALCNLLSTILSSSSKRTKRRCPTFRIHDGTTISGHGASGSEWRVHVTYTAGAQTLTHVEVTTCHGREDLQWVRAHPGDLVACDRNYGRARDIHTLAEQGVHPLVRVYLPTLTLESRKKLTLARLLQRADRGDCETDVTVPYNGRAIGARLILVPLPQAKAAEARRKLRQKTKKKEPDPKAMLLAGYLCLITTAPREVVGVPELVEWYGFRWQVEIYFKRCRSLIGLGALRKCGAELACVHILGKLLVAVLCERMIPPFARFINMWRSTQLAFSMFAMRVYASPNDPQEAFGDIDALGRIAESTRRRTDDWFGIRALEMHLMKTARLLALPAKISSR